MGTAVDDLRSRREPLERAMSAPDAALARVARWRVGERLAPPSRRDLQLKTLQSSEPHPLRLANQSNKITAATAGISGAIGAVTSSSRTDPHQSADAARSVSNDTTVRGSKTSTAPPEHKQEMVVLQDGDVDPLGVLSAGTADAFASISNSSVDGGVHDPANRSSASAAAAALSRSMSSMSVRDHTDTTKPPVRTVKAQWKAHTDRVLAKFENVTFKIQANMLEAHDLDSEISSRATYQRDTASSSSHVIQRTRERLEELERKPRGGGGAAGSKQFTRGDATVEMTQSEYVAKIRIMEAELVAAWEQNLKVAALRIAIKCVKLLGDTSSSPQLYPCVFVLVSDVLDTFGALVFERIRARASEDANAQPLPTPLAEHFVSTDVNIQAKETCRNWFYKTACIRELLPRIYIEIALLKCYRFLCDGEYPQIVARLSNMIKGVGEPMVALYARVYLALSGSELLPPNDTTAVLSSIFDYFFTFHAFETRAHLERWLTVHSMSHAEYLGLHSPAVEWLLKCAARGNDDDVSASSAEAFDTILAHYREYAANSMVLKHILEAFGPQCYAAQPLAMLELVRAAAPSQYSKCHLYSLLALQLSTSATLATACSRDAMLAFLNDAWTSITAHEDIAQYMECAAAYMKLIVAHFTHREALILLKDVVRHLNAATPAELTPRAYNLMGALIENVVHGAEDHYEFFTKLIPSGEFLTLMGMFKRESSVGVAKQVLQAFVGAERKSPHQHRSASSMRLHVVGPEAAVAHTLFVICCRVHDALDSLSTATERADATKDICAFIARLGHASAGTVSSEDEYEALLMLYIDCRSAFYKLEAVKTALVTHVLALAMHVHSRRTAAVSDTGGVSATGTSGTSNRRNFVKSCLAYAHITIPSIADAARTLELLVLAAKVAVVTTCLPQMDTFLKAAIIQISELDPRAFDMASSGAGTSAVSAGLDTGTASAALAVLDECEFLRASSSLLSPESLGLGAASATRESPLLRTLGDLVSVLVYAPSLTDDDAFYFVNALRKAVLERMDWDALTHSPIPRVQVAATTAQVRVELALLQLFGLWGQKRLPDRIAGLDSNDVLYGGDEAFAEQVHTHFADVIEDIVRHVEALDTIGSETKDADATGGIRAAASPKVQTSPSSGTHGGDVAIEVLSTQVELMLDFINQVVPLLELDEAKMPDASVSSSADLFAASSVSGSGTSSRRRRRGRCGAVLVRKCMVFIHEKVCALAKQAISRECSVTGDSRKRAAWLCAYYESTRRFVAAAYSAVCARGLLLSETSKQAIAAAEDALSNLAVMPGV